MTSRIVPNRPRVDDRFPMLGFTIRPDEDARQAEIAIAVNPTLFRPEAAKDRKPTTFWSSHAQGPLPITHDEAVFLVPPEVLARFVGQDRLYYTMATFGANGTASPQIGPLPTGASPYISLSGFTGRSLRRIRAVPSRHRDGSRYDGGSGDLTWVADTVRPGVQPVRNGGTDPAKPSPSAVAPRPAPVNGAAAKPVVGATPAPAPVSTSASYAEALANYDDGWPPPLKVKQPQHHARQTKALAEEAFSINWDDVELIPQPTKMGCWAAAAAMVVGWRDHVSPSVEGIAAQCKLTAENGLNAEQFRDVAGALGMAAETPACYTLQAVREMLGSYGPLWVAEIEDARHVIVVTGLYSDGTQTYVRIADPWDRVTGTPGEPGAYLTTHITGSRYILTWEAFVAEYDRAAMVPEVNLQIMHAVTALGRTPNTGLHPAGYAMVASQAVASQRRHPKPKPTATALIIGPEDVEKAQKYAPAWADLFNWQTPDAIVAAVTARNMTVQRIQDAQGELNLDRYEVRITTLPTGYDDAGLLHQVRTNLNDFVDTSNSEFIPYDAGVDDVKWNSASPEGAVFKIDIAGPKNAAVIGSLVEDQRWRFTTLHTEWSGDHPVSGHREFGIRHDGDAYVAYTRAADRATGPIGESLIWFGADKLWRSFQRKLCDWVNANGGAAEVREPFSERFHPAVVNILYGGQTTAQALAADAGDALLARGGAYSPAMAQAVRDARAQGASDEEISGFLDAAGVPAAPAVTAAALADEGQHYEQAAPAILKPWEAELLLAVIATGLPPPFGAVVAGAPALAKMSNCCIGFGLDASAAAAVGVGGGVGVVFGPGGEIGVYGSLNGVTGAIVSLSAGLLVTVTKGGIEHFAGSGVAVGLEVEPFAEGPSIGAQVLLDDQGVHGASFSLGAALTVTPLAVFARIEKTWAAHAQTQAAALALSRERVLPAPPPPRSPLGQSLAATEREIPSVVAGAKMRRVRDAADNVTWELDQLDGKTPPVEGATPTAGPMRDAPTIELDDWPYLEVDGGQTAFAHLKIDWKYDGQSLGDVHISMSESRAPTGWAIAVHGHIGEEGNGVDRERHHRPHVHRDGLGLHIRYRFTRPDKTEVVARTRLRLYPTGEFERTDHWDHG